MQQDIDRLLVQDLRNRAETSIFQSDGSFTDKLYLRGCSGEDPSTGSHIIFLRTSGYHSSGEIQEPEFERCYHLEIVYRSSLDKTRILEHDEKTSALWVKAFFGEDISKVWVEKPTFERPTNENWMLRQVRRYRVFCDANWKPIFTPIGPTSENPVVRWWSKYSPMPDLTVTPMPTSPPRRSVANWEELSREEQKEAVLLMVNEGDESSDDLDLDALEELESGDSFDGLDPFDSIVDVEGE